MIFHRPSKPEHLPGLLDGRRGFTLVELMIAVVLIAVLAALSAPTISTSMERGRVADLNRGVANSFLQTRSHAMRTGQAMFVNIETGDDAVITFYEPGNLGDAGSCVLAEDDGYTDTNTLRRISAEEFGVGVRFMDINPGGDSATICISPTGRVLSQAGTPLTATDACAGRNLVISLWNPDRGDGLGNCDLSDDTLAARELAHYSMIHIAEGGQVRVNR